MVMTNEANSNDSNTPETPTSHYFDPAGQEIITDVVQYLHEVLGKQNFYGLAVERYSGEYSLSIIQGKSATRAKFAPGQKEVFVQYFTHGHHLIENKYRLEPIPVEKLSSPDSYCHFNVFRKTKHDFEYFVEQGSLSREAADFLTSAYSAGVNILIGGTTGAGKTTFLTYLADSCKDYKSTILIHDVAEMSFGIDHQEIIELIAARCGSLLQSAITLKPQRLLTDGIYEDRTADLNQAADAGIQIVNTTHLIPVANGTGKIDSYSEFYTDHPFEIRVDLQMRKKEVVEPGKNSRYLDVVGIHQLIEDGPDKAKQMRTLFSSLEKLDEPTRSLRRKIEAGKKITAAPKGNVVVDNASIRPLVSVSEEEKLELIEHRDVLTEYFKNRKGLRERFEVIAKVISKF